MGRVAAGESALPGWMKVVFGLGVVLALVIAVPATLAHRQERQGWRILQAVAHQVATDAGAAELFRAQPDLRPGDDPAAFLRELQSWRPTFGEMPGEPDPFGRRYLAQGDAAGGGWALVQGRGGAWLGVSWQEDSGSLRMGFGPDRRAVREQLRQPLTGDAPLTGAASAR